MKVLLINSEHAPMGGAHTVYLNTADMLTKAGFEVICFAMHSSKELPCEHSSYFAAANVRSNTLQYTKNSFYNKDAAHRLQELIDYEHPDIAHIHLMWGCLAPSILVVLKKNRIPVIHTVHDYAMICSKVTLKANDGSVCERCKGGHFIQSIKTRCHGGSLVRSVVTGAEIYFRNKCYHPVDYIDLFHYVSFFCAEKHKEMDNRFVNAKQFVLYNVPDEKVKKIAEEAMPNTNRSYYLFYGRLAYEKGISTLIDAFSEYKDIKLKIVGTGPLETQLKEKCRSGNYHNIEFLGFKTGIELYKIVQYAKFVCVPSEWYENNPMTIIEAYTLGTPVIASRIGGIPEIVKQWETGFLFESGKKKDLIQVIQRSESLEPEQYRKMKFKAKEYAHNNFERDSYVQRLIEIYNNTINHY